MSRLPCGKALYERKLIFIKKGLQSTDPKKMSKVWFYFSTQIWCQKLIKKIMTVRLHIFNYAENKAAKVWTPFIFYLPQCLRENLPLKSY